MKGLELHHLITCLNSTLYLCTSTAAQKILEEALEKGYVECHIWKVLVTGAAGSGKTTVKYRLFGEEPPSLRCSTALAEAAIRAISRQVIGTDKTGWFRVTSDELMEMLGGALKAGVPMKGLPSKALEAPDYKKPGLFSRLLVWKSIKRELASSPNKLLRSSMQVFTVLQVVLHCLLKPLWLPHRYPKLQFQHKLAMLNRN